MTLVAGVDSSTQAVKVVVRDSETGLVVRSARAPHPPGTEVDPHLWWRALSDATSDGFLDGVSALAVAGQQHGMVALDDSGVVVRDALLWNDNRSAPDAKDLIAEFGGPAAWAKAVGSVPVASFTVTKLRWMARSEPANAARTAQVVLPHDWLTWQLTSRDTDPVTDPGDASGTGYWSPRAGEYVLDYAEQALGHVVDVPQVRPSSAPVGTTASGVIVAAGTGDNMAAALGLDASVGDVIVSLGTSGTAFAQWSRPIEDPTGLVAGFADATGEYLPLVCTLNAARVLDTTASLLGVTVGGLSDLALQAPPGANGLVLLPYLDGERTPNLPDAKGSFHGVTRQSLTPANLARAAVEGMMCGLVEAVAALAARGVEVRRIVLIGGAAASPAVQEVAVTVFDVPVVLPTADEYVANGAARLAAAALTSASQLPPWAPPESRVLAAQHRPDVLAVYRAAREQVFPASG